MIINFVQKALSVRDKGKIIIDGRDSYQASKKFFSLLPELYLKEWGTETVVLTANSNWSFFTADYTVTYANRVVGSLKTIKFWKGVFSYTVNGNNYTIYTHRGRKYSVFKDDKQIAYWSKGMMSVLEGDDYTIFCNGDCDYISVIAMCMMIDNYKRKGRDRSIINLDFGSLLQDRKFDANWVPTK